MNKYTFMATALISIVCGLKSVRADMPYYEDDEEYKHCAQATGRLDKCAHDEMLRNLETVKRDYRDILKNPTILKWHEDLGENTEILRDMYESWSAFRNRMCILAYVSSSHMKPTIDERYSCNLYYTFQHKAQLEGILQLMKIGANKKTTDEKTTGSTTEVDKATIDNLNKLIEITHDNRFNTCIQKEPLEDCLQEEIDRSSQEVKDMYKIFIADPYVGKWNNGPNLQRGNYRDMYDSWLAHRNRICQLLSWSMNYALGSDVPARFEMCLIMSNRSQTEVMRNLYAVIHSLKKEDLDNFNETVKKLKNTKPTRQTDGGEEIGRAITPLKRQISSGTDRTDDELVPTYSQSETQQQPSQSETRNKEIPAWAQQK